MKIMISTIVGIATIIGMFAIVVNASAMPDVHVSYSTDECVRVINYNAEDDYSCYKLPKKYNHVWVK